MAVGERPLSPHLQVWRWHVTMAASIFHRASGMALYAGAIGLVAWLFAVAAGPEVYAPLAGILAGPLGQIALFAVAAALAYHLGSGLRHLVWDVGHGYTPRIANLWGWVNIAFAIVAPLGVWALAGRFG